MKRKISKKVLAALAKGRKKLTEKRRGKKVSRRKKSRSLKHKASPINPIIVTEVSGMKVRKRRVKTKRRKRSRALHGAGSFFPKKRRSKRRVSRRRVRRLYGDSVKKPSMMNTLKDGAGVVGGVIGASAIAKMFPIANPKIKAIVPIGLGIILSMTKFGRKGVMKNVALGSVAIGALSLVKQLAPSLPLMGDEYMGYTPELSAEERALLGIPYNGEPVDGDMEGDELTGDVDGDEYAGESLEGMAEEIGYMTSADM